MNKWSELLIGLILLVGIILFAWLSSVYNWSIFGKSIDLLHAAWIVFKGFLFWMVFFVGLLLIILGINDLKN
jgi:hypothetical protein